MPLASAIVSALSGQYRVERELGSGGMATVHLAEDTRHRRPVAIKVLRPEIAHVIGRERFLREIQLVAQLQHPNIIGLIDSGEADGQLYYIMPFVAGESVRQRLARDGAIPVGEAVRLAVEVADALAVAHRRGVVHRDIKPENILLQEGHALVADFGIARAVYETGGERLTETGLSFGTPAYMSPEQIEGSADIDGRSDLYSLACVLFEMLSGAPPFRAATSQATLMKHMTESVPEVRSSTGAIPRGVVEAVTRGLAKNPGDRFSSAGDFGAAISVSHASGAARGASQPVETTTIVVLPFEDASPNPDDAFFATGLTDEVISDLSKVSAVRVTSRNTSMRLRGTDKDLRTIGAELGVRYAVTGSVRRAGDALRVTAELVDTATDTSIWGDKFSGTVSNVFDMQEQLARKIVDSLRVSVTPAESRRIASRDVSDIAVYERIVKARELTHSYDPVKLEVASTLLYEALALGGDNATVLAWLSVVQVWKLQTGPAQGEASIAIADEFAQRAMDLDSENPEALWAKSLVGWMREGARESVRWGRKAVAAERSAENLAYTGYSLSLRGESTEALQMLDEAIARDPYNMAFAFWRSWILLRAGRTKEAVEAARKVAASDFLMGKWAAGVTLCCTEHVAEGIRYLETVPDDPAGPVLFEFARLWLGSHRDVPPVDPKPSPAILEWTKTGDPFGSETLASMHARAGNRTEALRLLKFAIDRGFTDERWIAELDTGFAPLRTDPDFIALVERARTLRTTDPV